MSATILIPETTSAIDSGTFSVTPMKVISLTCNQLIEEEEIKVQIWHEVSHSFIDYIINGVTQKFNVDNVVVEIWDSALTYRISKPSTTNLVGVAINI